MYANAGILVHGYHLDAPDWEHVVWGSPPDQLGRLPRALLAARAFGAGVMVIGSGASARGGIPECRHMLSLLRDRVDALDAFEAFEPGAGRAILGGLAGRIVPDVEARTTREEAANAAGLFEARGCDAMVVVSSQFHAPRCLRDAASVLRAGGSVRLANHLYAAAADTDPPQAAAEMVAVVEPPHRPDRAGADASEPLRRLLALPEPVRSAALAELAASLDRIDRPDAPDRPADGPGDGVGAAVA